MFTPNLALIKAFIETFLKLKERSSLITKKHLDYYFKEILSQSPKTAQKDFVHVVIIPGINYDSFMLKKDNLFIAENEDADAEEPAPKKPKGKKKSGKKSLTQL